MTAADAARHADQRALAQSYSVIEWARVTLGQHSEERLSEEALRIYESLGDLEAQGRVMNNLGAVAYFADDWDTAITWYERARDTELRAGNHVEAVSSALNIGEILMNRGQYDEAEPLLRDAIRVFTATGFADGRAFAELYFGRMLLNRGDLETADAYLESALGQFHDLNIPGGALEAAAHFVICRVRRGMTVGAEDVLEEALAAAGNEAGPLEPTIARARAETMAALGRRNEAREYIDVGLDAADRHGLSFERRPLIDLRDQLDVIDLTEGEGASSAPTSDRLARTAPQ
jgi:tetratricopeptide (TPR) repeat protein